MWISLFPVYAVIFLIDRRLDERFGTLIGRPSEESHGQQGETANADKPRG